MRRGGRSQRVRRQYRCRRRQPQRCGQPDGPRGPSDHDHQCKQPLSGAGRAERRKGRRRDPLQQRGCDQSGGIEQRGDQRHENRRELQRRCQCRQGNGLVGHHGDQFLVFVRAEDLRREQQRPVAGPFCAARHLSAGQCDQQSGRRDAEDGSGVHRHEQGHGLRRGHSDPGRRQRRDQPVLRRHDQHWRQARGRL